MTRHDAYDVRVAPEVLEQIERSRDPRELVRFFDALDRLSRQGTRAPSAKKLESLDLWEVRYGDRRAFFCLVPGTTMLAVGAVLVKRSRKLRMSRLRAAERSVHRWRRRLEATG